jgi:hypothetical protein
MVKCPAGWGPLRVGLSLRDRYTLRSAVPMVGIRFFPTIERTSAAHSAKTGTRVTK